MAPKWDFPFGGTNVQPGLAIARSGSRCCQISGAGGLGPSKNLGTGLQVIQYPNLIQGVALNWDAISSGQDVLFFGIVEAGVQTQNVIITVNTDGSLSASKGAGDSPRALLGTSVTKPFAFNPNPTVSGLWNYLEAKVFVSRTVGSVEIRFAPPTGPMSVILSLTNQNTCAFATLPFCNQIQVNGPGALNQHAYIADYYISDWSDGSTYLGGVRIYADLPFANGSPVQFTPISPPNWGNVNGLPPNPPSTGLNSSGIPGQVDQYQHSNGSIPLTNSQIMAVQHVMLLGTDSGARQITSNAGGFVNPNAVFLSNGYACQTFPYLVNPLTGKPWQLTDFPFQFGPQVVS